MSSRASEEINWWEWRFSRADLRGPHENEEENEAEVKQLNSLLDGLHECAKQVVAYRRSKSDCNPNSSSSSNSDQHLAETERALEAKIDALHCGKLRHLKTLSLTDSQQFEAGLQLMVGMRESLRPLLEQLEESRNASDPQLERLLGAFRQSWEALLLNSSTASPQLSPHHPIIPWQLQYRLLLPTDETRVDFCGGSVTDREGIRINHVACSLCGRSVQHWAQGEGAERHTSVDSLANTCHCSKCHEAFLLLRNACARQSDTSSSADILDLRHLQLQKLELNDASSIWIAERNLGTFLRLSVSSQPSPASYISAAFDAYGPRLALGDREDRCSLQFRDSRLLHRGFYWFTFSQLGLLSRTLAEHLLTSPSLSLSPGSRVGILSVNCSEWAVADFASMLADCVVVGLHVTYSPAELSRIISYAALDVVFCSATMLPTLSAALSDSNPNNLRCIICLDPLSSSSSSSSFPSSVDLQSLYDIFAHLDLSNIPPSASTLLSSSFTSSTSSLPDLTSPATILFTSGSSGVPKGVIFSKASFRRDVGATIHASPLIGVSYIPLSHGSDRIRLWEFLSNGGRVGFATYAASNWIDHETVKKDQLLHASSSSSNNVECLLNDIHAIRPTAFAGPPRIWSGLHHLFNQRFAHEHQQEEGEGEDEDDEKKKRKERVRQQLLDLFGPNLAFVCTGGAPISPTVKLFARWFFPEHVRFAESYGATECGAITEDERAMAGVDIRLRSLTDVGLPAGYGEILVKTSTMSSGYLDPELTKAAFDDDGYFHTGDVGKYFRDEKDEKEGERLQIVERVGNVLFWKGEIILPTQLEASFQRSKFVRDVCILLLSSSQTLVFLVQIASSNTSMEDLKTDFLSLEPDLFACSSDGQSPVILISPCEWTVENKLLNIHFKKNRPVLQSFALSLINSSLNPK